MFVVIVIQTVACYFWGLSLIQWSVVIVAWRLVSARVDTEGGLLKFFLFKIHTVGLGIILHLQSTQDAVVKSFKVFAHQKKLLV